MADLGSFPVFRGVADKRLARRNLAADAALKPLLPPDAPPDQAGGVERFPVKTDRVGSNDLSFRIGDHHQVITAVSGHVEVGSLRHVFWCALSHRIESKRLHVAVSLKQIAVNLVRQVDCRRQHSLAG